MMLRVLLLVTIFWTTAVGHGQGVPYRNRGVALNKVVAANTVIDGVLVNDIFINDGLFEVQNYASLTNVGALGSFSFAAYDTDGMRRYTNNGQFIGMAVRFDTVDEFGYRTPATTFVNTVSGTMDLIDGISLGTGVATPQILLNSGYFIPLSNLKIDALNIENHGTIRLGAGGAGEIGGTNSVTGALTAANIDLSGGSLVTDEIGNTLGLPGIFDDTLFVDNNGFGTSYLNPVGVYDIRWGAGSYTNQVVQDFITVNPTQILTPLHRLTNNSGFGGQFRFFLTDAQSWGLISQTSPTNILIQSVFVQTSNTNVLADVRWTPLVRGADVSGNGLLTAVVKLSAITENPLTLQESIKELYISDQLGSASNRTVIPNDKFAGYMRPLNYFINRADPVFFNSPFSTVSNTVVTPDLFFGPDFGSPVVTNFYSGYHFQLVNLVYSPPFLQRTSFSPPVTVHDLPGRFEIRGQKLNLTDTGIRGEGLISIDSPNVVQPTGTIIDAQNLAFNFAFTNTDTTFQFKGLSKKEVSRFGGDVQLWSGVWTNQFTNVVTGVSNTLVTNIVNLLYHALVVNATELTQTQRVSVADFNVQALSLNIQDDMVVSNRFTSTARDLTVSGNVELVDNLFSQSSSNLQNLANLTVESTGRLTLIGLADFGLPTRSISNFVNRGTISSYSQSIFADNVDITGTMISGQNGIFLTTIPNFGLVFTNGFITNSGPFYINANRSARLTGATLATYGDVFFAGPVFKFSNTTVSSGSTINLDVTEALQDAGLSANNVFVSSNSFAMNTVAGVGNLLGSSFVAQPPPRGTFRMLWATPTNTVTSITNIPTTATWPALTNQAFIAFSTNTAIGRLRLESGTNTVFEFTGTRRGSALFVDTIEIVGTGITNLASLNAQIRLITNSATSIDIYYADIIATNLQKGLNLTFTNLAEFFNNRKFPGGGTFHWVPNFNGPNSSEDVVQTVVSGGVTNQVSVSMNRALRRSLIIDMDGDGIANGNDSFPNNNQPGPLQIANIRLSSVDGHINVEFAAYSGMYSLQTATTLEGKPTWKTVSSVQQSGRQAGLRTLADPDPISDNKRFYRLIYAP